MAAVTPVTKGTAGWVPPGVMYLSDANATPDTLTNAAAERRIVSTGGLIHERWFFSDVDNGEIWTTPPAGTVALAAQILSHQAIADVAPSLNAARQVLWSAGTNNGEIILHTWRRGAKTRSSGSNVTPVSKGTEGYLGSGVTYLRHAHDNGATDPLPGDQTPPFSLTASGKLCPTSDGSLRHVVLYFTGVDASLNDTWTPTARVFPRMVDFAWQPVSGLAADRVQLAFTDTVLTFYGDASSDGWLHLWMRG